MRGKSKFERKQAVLEVDEFAVEAVTVLSHDQYNRFANNLLYDYDFINEHNDKMCVDSDGITHVLLVLDEEGEDGILVNSEGSAYARYTGYMSGAKKKLRDEIKEITDAKHIEFPVAARFNEWRRAFHMPLIELPEDLYQKAVAFGDTAIFCVARYSAEGDDNGDRPGTKGDFYLRN